MSAPMLALVVAVPEGRLELVAFLLAALLLWIVADSSHRRRRRR
jgi:hypothetical protein